MTECLSWGMAWWPGRWGSPQAAPPTDGAGLRSVPAPLPGPAIAARQAPEHSMEYGHGCVCGGRNLTKCCMGF